MRKWLIKFIYGKYKVSKRRKRRLMIFIAASIMILGGIVNLLLRINVEYFLLGGFGMYTLSELFE